MIFGFIRPRQKERRPPGLPAIRTGAGEQLTGRAGRKPNLGGGIPGQSAEDFTRSILFRILSENHYEMSISGIIEDCVCLFLDHKGGISYPESFSPFHQLEYEQKKL
ncbi:MAG: hypothetical protein D8M57_03735 [Candidatus Scalindua sp. AMX11]|nr:MAG: hypothetical protein DWQ00_10960 [Candidatus Scalindua sp.]TDE66223.1 MAG: hypothetical protein D8M57_03735 [Candidatus Scalindua sp. AMX11]